jgi:hypothetical protein
MSVLLRSSHATTWVLVSPKPNAPVNQTAAGNPLHQTEPRIQEQVSLACADQTFETNLAPLNRVSLAYAERTHVTYPAPPGRSLPLELVRRETDTLRQGDLLLKPKESSL